MTHGVTATGISFPDGSVQTTASSGKAVLQYEYTASGSHVVGAGCVRLEVWVAGASGAGGKGDADATGNGGSGGNGGVAYWTVDSPTGSYTFNIGAGGTAPTTNNNTTGGNGGTTTFSGGSISITGGGGGYYQGVSPYYTGGAGGVASGGTSRVNGTVGTNGTLSGAGTVYPPAANSLSNGATYTSPSSSITGTQGGNGAPPSNPTYPGVAGKVIILEWYN